MSVLALDLEDVLCGSQVAVARLITASERDTPGVLELMEQVHAAAGHAHVVGVTGIPGGGKSTLVAQLTAELRRRDRRVAVVAIDPSSPYSGGAVLGDRVRMAGLAGDPGVFIRSMSSRGNLGGLARSTSDAVAILDAAGNDVIIIETVGVGQDEVSIAAASHTTLVVSVPGTGDEVQALKAGVLEIADAHVVNKADRPGAQRLVAHLREMLRYAEPDGRWEAPVMSVIAVDGTGIDELCDVVEDHRDWLRSSGELAARERLIAEERLRNLVHALIEDRLADAEQDRRLAELVDQVARRELSPIRAARRLLDDTAARRSDRATIE